MCYSADNQSPDNITIKGMRNAFPSGEFVEYCTRRYASKISHHLGAVIQELESPFILVDLKIIGGRHACLSNIISWVLLRQVPFHRRVDLNPGDIFAADDEMTGIFAVLSVKFVFQSLQMRGQVGSSEA